MAALQLAPRLARKLVDELIERNSSASSVQRTEDRVLVRRLRLHGALAPAFLDRSVTSGGFETVLHRVESVATAQTGMEVKRARCGCGRRWRGARACASDYLLVALALGGVVGRASGDFDYPDFATVCDPTLKCAPKFQGTLSCCMPFGTDAESNLHLNSGAHFQTCAQFNSPTGEVEGLSGRDVVFNRDTANDPQIMITQLTEIDYEASPRRSLTYNWTRSVFEEVVRRRDELRAMLVTAIEKLRDSRKALDVGLEPDANGQVWLIIAMHQAEVTKLEKLYNETLERDRKLYLEHTAEYVAVFPHNDYGSACDNRIRLTPAAPTRRGSIWYRTPQTVTHGFTTSFRFQLSARNRLCKRLVEAHADQMKGVALTVHYDECLRAVWNSTEWSQRVLGLGGGDGFAFVIQGGSGDVLGQRGNQLGFGGIEDSIAVEFDTYQNKELDDVNDMHVAVHTGGCRKGNGADGGTRLAHYGPLRTTDRYLQDGEVSLCSKYTRTINAQGY